MANRVPTSLPWFHGEQAIRIRQIADHVPRCADGRKVSRATAYRWMLTGRAGIRPRTFVVGGARCTTVEELSRWMSAVTQAVAA